MKFIFYTLIFCSSIISGQSLKVNQPKIDWINSNNGLQQNSVKYITVDKDNFTWLATEMGLYKYDGKNVFLMSNNKFNINTQRITWMSKDVLTKKLIFRTFPKEETLTINENSVSIEKEPAKSKGIITSCYFYPNKIKAIRKINKFIENKYKLNNNYYFSNNSFYKHLNYYYCIAKNDFYKFDSRGYLVKKFEISQNSILIKLKGKLLIINKNGIFSIEKNDEFKKIITDSTFELYLKKIYSNNSIGLNNNFFSSSDTNHYIKIYNKIYKLNLDKTLTTEFLFNTYVDDINYIFEKEKNEIYLIGTNSQGLGVVRLSKFNLLNFGTDNVNTHYTIAKIGKDKWVNANGWVFNKTTKGKHKVKNTDNSNPFFIFPYKKDTYIQNYTKKNTYDFVNIKNGKIHNDFKNLNVDYFTTSCKFNNTYWLGSGDLYYITNNTIKKDNFLDNYCKDYNFLLPFNNTILIATSKGVFRYMPTNKKIKAVKGLENVYARFLSINDANSFWVGSYGDGIYFVKDLVAYKVRDNNVNIKTCHAVVEDNYGNLWISSNEGLFTISKEVCISKTLKKKTLDFYKFTTNNGLPNNEFNGGGSNPFLKDNNDIIGFPNISGFVWFDTKKVIKHPVIGKIRIEYVKSDNAEVFPKNQTYEISKKIGIINILFSFPYYFDRDNIIMEYKLQDDGNWNRLYENKIVLARKENGKKLLSIRVRTCGVSNKNTIYKSILLDFKPKVYETLWFWSIVTLVCLIIVLSSYYLGLQFNKKKKKILENKISLKTRELEVANIELKLSNEKVVKSLKVKEILLKEIHHRVKNNLQLVISLLNIQARRQNYQNINDFLQNGQTRINAMILIHQNLYQNETVEKLNVKNYLNTLLKFIVSSYGEESNIKLTLKTNNILLDLQTAIPFGLIINELATNTIKYAFPNKNNGEIKITLNIVNQNDFVLIYKDNGIGFKKKLKGETFGLELIELLVNQLNGNVTLNTTNGTEYIITFSESNITF